MAVSLLWMGLALLGVLQSQAQPEPKIPAPDLSRVPLQDNFQLDRFQGKWFVVGVAGNAFTREDQGQFKMYSTAFDLQKDDTYRVTFKVLRDDECERFVRTYVQKGQRGHFALGNLKSYGLQDYIIRVVRTNYNEYAIMYFKKTLNNVDYFKIVLYGRRDDLRPELKKDFTNFVKTLRLTDENIVFPVKINTCIYDA
ncbi:neutrophil gelatinase-associated lipocalin-like isoform X2 [Gracilinanus agilis]|uniref:neutrophil gelatinase-associated lipocalin-like isoform X2 n=1 Tax=Gracilinanus agilis TaxID=191870 RepID=UPI001CFCD031|nr:neutrophil gelatinase-associated lipocalin-like isoform X2 [Gracilinanus agilis]